MRAVDRFLADFHAQRAERAGDPTLVATVESSFGKDVDVGALRKALVDTLTHVAGSPNTKLVDDVLSDMFAHPVLSDGNLHRVVVDILMEPWRIPPQKLYASSSIQHLPRLGVRMAES